ncbi:MAG: caspase family protein [Lentisphaeria bacterium]|nr:caspase family protein [Lentisphaeria bacterium]
MRRYGLFVGVDNYKNGISSLSCSCNDAKELSLYFAQHFDKVDFLLDEDAHCEDVLDRVEEMTKSLSSGDLFVFYFAGHGREFNGEHFLVGPSGRASAAFYRKGTVTVPELLEASNKSGLNRLFILDCCRTDLIAGRGEAFVCSDARDLSLISAMEAVENNGDLPPLIINSCSTGQQAFELQNEKHGVFTKALLDVLSQKTPVSDFTTLFTQLNARIKTLIPAGRNQNISSAGNVDLWNNIPLFANWVKKTEKSPEVPKTEVPKAEEEKEAARRAEEERKAAEAARKAEEERRSEAPRKAEEEPIVEEERNAEAKAIRKARQRTKAWRFIRAVGTVYFFLDLLWIYIYHDVARYLFTGINISLPLLIFIIRVKKINFTSWKHVFAATCVQFMQITFYLLLFVRDFGYLAELVLLPDFIFPAATSLFFAWWAKRAEDQEFFE